MLMLVAGLVVFLGIHLLPTAPGLRFALVQRWGEQRHKGAFSLVVLAEDRIIVARDPHGFRPLAMGQMENKSYVFASETCAFDLIGADYVRDVKPGELIVVGPEGVSSRFYSTAAPQSRSRRHSERDSTPSRGP